MRGRMFFAAEIEAYRYGSGAVAERGHLIEPHLAPDALPQPLEATATIRASTLGYRTPPGDALQEVYPGLLDTAFEIDRRMTLSPQTSACAAAWGSLRLLNPDGQWDAVAGNYTPDGRQVSILLGFKDYDEARGVEADPSYATLNPVFRGLAQPWFLSESELAVPLRDASYWLDRPLQSQIYLGTGSYEGTAELVGVPKPKLRGGVWLDKPVRNITPVLVDPANRIYQFSDGPAFITALYEGGAQTILFQANTNNLYSGTTTSGYFRQDPDRGLFQLGTTPARQITIDAVGNFVSAGTVNNPVAIAKGLLLEDMALAAAHVDSASFDALTSTYSGFAAGWYFGPTQISSVDALDLFLRSVGAKLLPARSGKLTLYALRAIASDAPTAFDFTTDNVVDVTPRQLEAILDPPPYRLYVGYNRINTLQSASDLNPTVSDAQRQVLAKEWSSSGWSSETVMAAYRRPNDPPIIQTALLDAANAQALVNELGALWGTRRRLYDVRVPFEVGLQREVGEVVSLTYPMDDLRSGRVGQIVGEQIRSTDTTITLQVLI